MGKTESFEFLNELALAFRRGEKHPRPQHTPILEGIRAVLAHLQSTGRLIPAGGIELTAERIEELESELSGVRRRRMPELLNRAAPPPIQGLRAIAP